MASGEHCTIVLYSQSILPGPSLEVTLLENEGLTSCCARRETYESRTDSLMLSYERIRQGSSILITVVVCFISLALFAQSLFSLYLMLYSWEHPERVQSSRGPRSFLAPHYSFTVLLPAQPEIGSSFGIEQILPAVLKPARPGAFSVLSRAPLALWRKVDALWSAGLAQARVRPATTLLPRGAHMPVRTRSALASLALEALLVLCLKGSGLPSAAHSIAHPSIHSHTSVSHRGSRPIERSTSVAGKSN